MTSRRWELVDETMPLVLNTIRKLGIAAPRDW